jgi:mono/diheme cytochrome c family protein
MKRRLSVLAGAGLILAMTASTGSSAETTHSAQAEKGKAIFEENCVACHQQDGKGLPGTAPSLTNKEILRYASDRFFTATINEGRPDTPMPAFAEQLKPEDVQAVIAYLRSFATGPGQGPEIDAESPAKGDIALGKLRFDQICSSCHGNDGEGYEAGGSGTAIAKSGLLSKASDGFLRATIREGRSNTPMHGFVGSAALANLTYAEVDGIISYLRSRQGK